MPELPEVETIKRVIGPQIRGLVIEKVAVRRPEVISYPAADEFCRRLAGQTISHITRRGKFLTNPARPAKSLKFAEWERLAAAILERLSYFIEVNKVTPEEYLENKGQDYRNTPFLQVYGQEGKSCPGCGETLRRIIVGGRSSVYCPACQKKSEE